MRKYAIIALLVICLNLVLAEALARIFVAWTKPHQTSSQQFDLKYQIAQRTELLKHGQESILFLGNSHVKSGIYPELVALRLRQAGLDYDVRNLASDGASPSMSLFLLKTAMATGVKPRLVVFNVWPITFSKFHDTHPALNQEESFRNSYLGRCKYRTPESWQANVKCALEKYSYLFRHRRELKEQIYPSLKAVLNPEPSLKYPATHVVDQEVSPRGWSPGYQVYTEAEFEERVNENDELHMTPAFRRLRHAYRYQWTQEPLMELTAFCKQHRIPLVLLWMPRHPGWLKQYAYLKITSREEEEMAGRLKRLEKDKLLRVVDWHEKDRDDTHYFDSAHLNVLGASKLSEDLATLLLSPPYRDILQTPEPVR